MSSTRSAGPLVLELKPSKILLVANTALHGGAAMAVWVLPLLLHWRIFAIAFICATCCYYGWQYCLLRNGSSIVRIVWDSDDNWELIRRDGQSEDGLLLGDSTVYARFAVINFFTGPRWRRRSVLLTPDCVDPEQFRQLRVRLNIANPQTDGFSPPDA